MGMRRFQGVAASSGVARGPWVRIVPQPRMAGGRIDPSQAGAEVERLRAAAAAAAADLVAISERMIAEDHAGEGGIFAAQAEMARDPALVDAAATHVGEGMDAIAGVHAAADQLAGMLRSLGDEILSARAADVEDVASRIVRLLAGVSAEGPSLERPSIVVAEDLAPSVTATLRRDRLLGLALEGGSATAHAAILARAYGIPAVVGVEGLLAELEGVELDTGGDGHLLAIDGDLGEVILDPDEAAAARIEERSLASAAAAAQALEEAVLPAVTRDGTEVTLLANIGTPAEAGRAVALGAHGVGLFRTEFLFSERPAPPTEEEQLAAYREVLEAFRPHPVTIRLLDVGGDKPIPYLAIAPEANPFLGVRALRLAVDRPEVFVTQLRAAMRAAAPGPPGSPALGPALGSVKVMAPMVADATDVELLLGLVDRAAAELDAAGVPRGPIVPGVMLEIPAAVLVADTYLERLGFASLGTNDLLQYTIAADRGNRDLARYHDPLHPALLRLVRDAVRHAARAGAELSVCGEMAGDPAAALALVGLGIRHLSMASSSLGPVRRAIRAVELATLQDETRLALELPSAAAARSRFAALLPQVAP